jgi:hypothetical protein
MRVHAVADADGKLVAIGAMPPEGDGAKVQLSAGPGQTRHELELPGEFESKSPVDLHQALEASDLNQFIVAST